MNTLQSAGQKDCPQKKFGSFAVFFSSFVIFSLITSPAFAQVVVPKTAEPHQLDKRFSKPQQPKATFDDIAPAVPKLPVPEDMDKIKFVLQGITFEGVTIYKEATLLPFYEKYLGQEVSLGLLFQIAKEITAKYRNDGYLLTQAVVPPQKISGGIARIKVGEGFIDNIEIKGDVTRDHFNRLEGYASKLKQSRPLKAEILERYLLLLNDLPGVTAKSVITPSETVANASMLTIVLTQKQVDLYANYNNRGSKFNGPVQWSAGVGLNSILGFGFFERTEFNYISSIANDGTLFGDELKFFSALHEQTITNEGTKFIVSGTVSSTEPGHTLLANDVKGNSSTLTLSLYHPLIRSREKNLSVQFGYTGRDAQTKIGGTLSTSDKIRVLDLGTSFDFVDAYQGINLITFQLSQGLDVFGATEPGNLNATRAAGQNEFTKFSGNLLRLQQITPKWSILAEGAWQFALDDMLAAEEFRIGGARFVRGYDAAELTGDSGVALSGELRFTHLINKAVVKNVQLYGFLDHGIVWHRHPDSGIDTKESRSSTGLGARLQLVNYLSASLEAARPLSNRSTAEGDKDTRIFFNLEARY